MLSPRHPNIIVTLTGVDGNAFSILGTVIRGLRKASVSEEEIGEFKEAATSGDYDHLLRTCMEWVTCK